MSAGEEPRQPVLRIVRGNPTPEDVAALLGVVASLGAGPPAAPEQTSAWVTTARKGRYLPRPGASAWRLSVRNT